MNPLRKIDKNYRLSSWLFLRLLALIFFAAFISLYGQLPGLVGENGILPLVELQQQLLDRFGMGAWWRLPTLFWFESSDLALQGAALAGAALALLLLLGVWQRLSLLLMVLLYLSCYHAGQTFMNFQWDTLLIETGLLAIFLVRGPSWLVLLLLHWLLFRLRFLSGLSKWLSGDPSWGGLTALNYYFETQPLPHIGSWYAHQLPAWLLQGGTALVLFSELVVPFFIFLPRRFRIFAAILTIAIQVVIIATSNHNFVNLLTILLALLLLDDRIVGRLLPRFLRQRLAPEREEPTATLSLPAFWIHTTLTVVIFSISLPAISHMVGLRTETPWLQAWQRLGSVTPLTAVGSAYHIFPTMQTERQELEIEGSIDGVVWHPYRFRYKPGPVEIPPPFNVPHQPRLDWMIWFVPPQHAEMRQWFDRFLYRLWQNEPAVTSLLAVNPFEGGEPPRYLRVHAWRYRFTTPEERQASGHWWQREYLGLFPQTPPRRP
ncbi:MAG: lipase maturation factor family protein [Gammaproteobacteria bacterium]|nr:lipase maturation factor family protein [Gammaproteobacteria bacterium]